ncbi:MAG TPA: DUF885 domain-containing protein [Gemmatimonadaceae bacterium]|nr:DUF885 domain-containing protein [Gemmatimonadaceae bacterium]
MIRLSVRRGMIGVSIAVIQAVACTTEKSKTASTDSTGAANTAFSTFVDTYFDSTFAYQPSFGTASGFHQYDNHIEDFSAPTISRRIATLRGFHSQLNSLKAEPMSANDSIDAAMIDGAIKSELQDLEVIGNWKKNPMGYVGTPGNAIDLLMKRNFAPPAERLKSVTARLRGIPAIMAAMKANVQNPPREFTDLAIRIAGGSVGFFRNDIATWAKGAAGTDSAALRAFTAANDSAAAALDDAAKWLKSDLLPRSKGTYAIGAKAFADKLLYDEMVDIPLDRLLALGEANLKKDHDAFVATAQIVAPGKTPAEAMASLELDHPTAENLIPSAKATVEGIRQFLVDKKIVDIPSDVRPDVVETPPYARSGGFASMDSPGAYEAKATEAFYYVTPPEKDWDKNHIEEHLRLFNKSVMNLITIHEVFPGHFLQFVYSKQFPTRTRKLLYASSNAEGWAHYSEQMMVDEGYGNGDPKIRLAQLSEALLRDCRWVVGMREHTRGLSVDEGAKKYFTEQCFQQPANGYEEARRGAYNPTYLYYTLGKLEIMKLRSDYQKVMGTAYSIGKFHTEFVKQGGVPIKVIRKILIPGDTASIL